MLNLSYKATKEDVRMAYEIAMQTFHENSLATYSLFSDDENDEIMRKITKAYMVLVDSHTRREYDAKLLQFLKSKDSAESSQNDKQPSPPSSREGSNLQPKRTGKVVDSMTRDYDVQATRSEEFSTLLSKSYYPPHSKAKPTPVFHKPAPDKKVTLPLEPLKPEKLNPTLGGEKHEVSNIPISAERIHRVENKEAIRLSEEHRMIRTTNIISDSDTHDLRESVNNSVKSHPVLVQERKIPSKELSKPSVMSDTSRIRETTPVYTTPPIVTSSHNMEGAPMSSATQTNVSSGDSEGKIKPILPDELLLKREENRKSLIKKNEETLNQVQKFLNSVTEYSGNVLGQIRKMKGVSLSELSTETCVREYYLTEIEAENFEIFNAIIYLKGYLRVYAKAIQLPEQKVVDDYVARYNAWKKKKKK
ncbi:helix-turn-helix domain-containing protein [Deltaproteobacteria bacterium TL4]